VLHPAEQAPFYPAEVHHRIRKDQASDYTRTARSLNDCADVVSLQHEYGIWGGADGEHVIDFVGALRVPVVATLHTVLREPTAHQREVLRELVSIAEASVVMSSSAADLLSASYGVNPRRVHVIPHGVPDVSLVDSAGVKPGLGIPNRAVILSFGLLGPGKGYELAIDALPAVVAEHPNVLYVMVGATHPNLLLREGEAYRRSLAERVAKVGMEDHVQFIDRFVSKGELTQWLQAADVFVTPYPNMAQIVSGTLSYAMGAGRAIVSTPYAYAAELLADGRGVLVPPGSADGFAAAINTVLGNPALRADIGKRAYAHTRPMVWSAVGGRYRDLFAQVVAGAPAPLPVAHAERADERAPQLAAAHG
jgi:glycosyltransferase involved in cell wall biosynthesis